MISVANLNDLLQGITDREELIEVTASFAVDRQIYLSYPVTIRGAEGALITLQRQQGYTGSLFYIDSNGDLTLQNITVNGNKAAVTAGVDELISVSGGKLTLNQAVLEENKAISGGGALYLADTGAVCLMENNAAIRNCEADGGGGGAFISSGCSLTARNSAITGNIGVGGGGIYAIGTVSIVQSLLSNNSAGRQPGGGIYAAGSYCTVRLEGSTVSENLSSDSGGGLYGYNGAAISIDSCTIFGNQGGGNGGGIGIASSNAETKITVSGCKIDNNQAVTGGGLYGVGSLTELLLEACTIHGNSATLGGGMALNLGAEADISQGTKIEGNTANNFGGGVYIDNTSVVHVTDSTFSANIASRGGSGLYNGGQLGVKGTVMITDGVSIPSARHLIQVEGPLTSSQIQIEASDYVAPGSGAPIPLAQAQTGYPILSAADVGSFLKPAVGFRNWKVEANAGNTQVLLTPAIVPIEYEISFHGNATCCTPASDVPGPVYVEAGGSGTIPDIIPKRKCYSFAAWNTVRNGSGISYAPGQVIPDVNGSFTLYAIWRQKLLCSCCCKCMCRKTLRS